MKEGYDTMSAVDVNYVYEVKNKGVMKELEKFAASREMKERCKKVAEKYPAKK